MKVILTTDVRGVGKRGDEKEVADGYAGNYLFPRKLAVPASAGAAKGVQEAKDAERSREKRSRSRARNAARILRREPLVFDARVSPAGKLYSAVSKADISAAVERLTGVSGCGVGIGKAIKEPGKHNVKIILDSDTAVDVVCDVRPIES